MLKKGNLLLALGTTLVCLLILEIGTRGMAHLENRGVLDGGLGDGVEIPAEGPVELGHIIRLSTHHDIVYELKPDLAVTFRGASVTTDRRGFRVTPSAHDDPSAVAPPHLVGLGDSFMFGYGVDDDQTYLAGLQSMLDAGEGGPAYRVVNTAVPGYNTVMEVETLRRRALDLDPEVVVIEFVENDLSLPNFIRAQRPVWTLERSLFVDFVRHRLGQFRHKSLWRRLQFAGLQGVPQVDGDEGTDTSDPSQVPETYRHLVGWQAYEQGIQTLRDVAEEQSFTVVSIFLAPHDSELKSRAMDLSRTMNFHVLDVGQRFSAQVEEQGFADYLASPLALSPTDGHPSVLGHRLAAETLHAFLVHEQIIAE